MQNTKVWTDQIGMISGLDEILTRPIPEPKLVLSSWLAEGESALIHAGAGVGKTLVALSFALAAATGATVLNTTGAKVPVLYIDGEMGEADLQERATLLCNGMDADIKNAADFHLIQASGCPSNGTGEFPYLDEELNRTRIKRLVASRGIKLVVIDNLRCLVHIEDENAASSFNEFNQFLSELAALKAAVLIIHHNNKSHDYSGNTAIETPLSIRTQLTAKTPTKAKNACFDVTTHKDRRGVDCAFTRDFTAELDRDTGVWSVTAGNVESQLLDFKHRAGAGEFIDQKEAAEAYGVDPRTIRTWVAKVKLGYGWDDEDWSKCTTKAKALQEIATMTDEELALKHGDDDVVVPFGANCEDIY